MIWSGAPAQTVIVASINTGSAGAVVTCDLGLPRETLAPQRNDRLLPIEFGPTTAVDNRAPTAFAATEGTNPAIFVEVLGGVSIVNDTLLPIEFPIAVLRDLGAVAQRTIYRRFSRFGVSGRVRRWFLSHGRSGTLALESSTTLHGDQNTLNELLAIERADRGSPVEVLGTGGSPITGDAFLSIEGLAVRLTDWGTPVESLAAAGASVIGNSLSPIEMSIVERGDAGAAIECTATLPGNPGIFVETLIALTQDSHAAVEALAVGATTVADATLALEWGGAGTAVLLSLEAGPDRIRLLVTPGRIRLLRRN